MKIFNKIISIVLVMTMLMSILPIFADSATIVYTGDVGAGETVSDTEIILQAKPQYDYNGKPQQIQMRNITMELSDNNNQNLDAANEIVMIQPLRTEKPDIGFLAISPSVVYYDGPAQVSVKGYGDNFDALRDKSQWDMYLTKFGTDGQGSNYIDIDCESNASVDTANKQINVLFDMKHQLGYYELHIVFKDKLASLGEYILTSDGVVQKQNVAMSKDSENIQFNPDRLIRSSSDPKYKNRGYSIAIIARISEPKETPRYEMKLIMGKGSDGPETIFANYEKSIKENKGEILAEARGLFAVNYKDDNKKRIYETGHEGEAEYEITSTSQNGNIKGFTAISGGDPVKLNRILYYDSNIPMTFTNYDDHMSIEGNGNLSVVNASTIWQNKFEIKFQTEDDIYYSYDDNILHTGNYKPVQLNLQGGEFLLQNIGGMIFDFNCGVIDKDDDFYTISFGGSLSLPLGFSAFDKKNIATRKTSQKQIDVSVDTVLYGEHENIDDAKIVDTGFIGAAMSVDFELPDWVLPSGGSQDNNQTVIQGTTNANSIGMPYETELSLSTQAGLIQAKKQGSNFKTDTMSGFKSGFSFNTFDWYSGVDLGIRIGMINTALRVSFREINNEGILDSFYFQVSDFQVPIGQTGGVVTELGGGFSDLAAMIGEGVEGPPPLTAYLMTMIKFAEAVGMKGDMSANALGMAVNIKDELPISNETQSKSNIFKLQGNLDADWSAGFVGSLNAKVQVCELFSGAMSLGIATDPEFAFMGKAKGSLVVPGIGKIDDVTFMVSDEYFAGGAKILIFSGGAVVCFDSGELKFLSSSEIDSLETVNFGSAKLNPMDASTDENMNFLEVRKSTDAETGESGYIAFGAGAEAISTSIPKYKGSSNLIYKGQKSYYQYQFDIDPKLVTKKEKDIVVRLDYTGMIKPELTLQNGVDVIPLIAYDQAKTQSENDANKANELWAEREKEDGTKASYVYISIPANDLKSGTYTVKSTNKVEIQGTDFTLPAITAKSVKNVTVNNFKQATADKSGRIDIEWEAIDDATITVSMLPVDENGNVVKQIITDSNGVPYKDLNGKNLEVDNAGYILAQNLSSTDYLIDFEIPNIIPTGKYIVRVDGIVNTTTLTCSDATEIIKINNPNELPKPIIKEVKDIGNGTLKVVAEVDENATGMVCQIYKKPAIAIQGEIQTAQKLVGIGGYVGAYDGLHEINEANGNKILTAYFAGGVNILNNTGGVRERAEITTGDEYKVEVTAVNIDVGTKYLSSEAVSNDKYVKISEPDRPELDVKITSGMSAVKTDERGNSYIQSDSSMLSAEYEIKNAYDKNENLKEAYKTVDVQILIDNLQYGNTVTIVPDGNNGTLEGCVKTSLSDGEHLIKIIATNANGDRTVYTTKIAIDSIPADLKITKPQSGDYIDTTKDIELNIVGDIGADYEICLDGKIVAKGKLASQTEGKAKTYKVDKNGNFVHDANGKLIKASASTRVGTNNDIFQFSIPIPESDRNKFSYQLDIELTDKVGHKTQCSIELINQKIKDIEGIKISSTQISKTDNEIVEEFHVDALDKNNNVLLRLPKEKVVWELFASDLNVNINDRDNRDVVVKSTKIIGSYVPDYVLIASYNICDGYAFTDSYANNINIIR